MFKDMWRAFLSEVDRKGILDWDEAFVDASFFPANRGRGSREDQAGKGSKCLVLVDGQGIPLGIHIDSASPGKVPLSEATLNEIRVPGQGWGVPKRGQNG